MEEQQNSNCINLIDQTNRLVGFALKMPDGFILLYDSKGRYITKVNSKTTVKTAIRIILSSSYSYVG